MPPHKSQLFIKNTNLHKVVRQFVQSRKVKKIDNLIIRKSVAITILVLSGGKFRTVQCDLALK